ncbi:hypothetical protein HMPREF3291_18145 [Bacillus sp. HMSC76G11]|nr:hypothetical protein HMPREF3291_18145 [Bacillus sp. HMSC76G11]
MTLREIRAKWETPQAGRGGSHAPRRKQVPGAESNGQHLCLKTTIYAKKAYLKEVCHEIDSTIG